jgi:hypothetical protein
MVDDRPEENGSPVDSDRPKRAPPTIDLKATEVSSAPQQADGDAPSEQAAEASPTETPVAEETPAAEQPAAPPVSEPAPRPVSPWIIAPVSGAVAAALVIGIGWMLGWPEIQPADSPAAPTAAIDGLTARIAAVESKVSKPGAPATDPAAAARMEATEKSLAALRGELATLRAQGEKLAAALDDVKAAPRDGAVAAGPDLAAVNERIAGIEKLVQAQGAEIAQQGSKIAAAKVAEAKPADDVLLRRVVAAALLDVQVRIGDPYQAALATAKSLAPNPDALKPLEEFAAKGVPSSGRLSGELLALVPKLTPAAQPDNATSGSGIVERLQAGAAKLVRIERTNTTGNDRGAVVARLTAAALRNDSNEARRELKTLEPADRAAAQAWLERADARDAALAASRQFATDAMTALAKPAQ